MSRLRSRSRRARSLRRPPQQNPRKHLRRSSSRTRSGYTPMTPPPTEPGVKRPLPDYDNRPPEPVTAGDVLIWVPRITFLPLHVVLEYGLRWPIIRGITFAEKEKVFKRVERIFTFRDGKSGIFPTALIDFGLKIGRASCRERV